MSVRRFPLIGICSVGEGSAGNGKSTLAQILTNHHGFSEVTFAEPIKRMLRDVYGWSYDQLYGSNGGRDKPDERGRVPRIALLRVGEALLSIDMESLADRVLRIVTQDEGPVVVSDVRGRREADRLRVAGAAIWGVRRLGARRLNGEAGRHWTESGIDASYVDAVFELGGRASVLKELVDQRVREMAMRRTA